MLAAIVLAFALAMDATAVAAARGLSSKGRDASREGHDVQARDAVMGDVASDVATREAVLLPALFGAFQSGMAALGWLLGAWGGPYIEAWDHWIAFALLSGIGAKMLYDAYREARAKDRSPDDRRPPNAGGAKLYLLLALATSIDAAAAGITLPLLAVTPVVAIVLIGVVTAACSAVGYVAGRAVGGSKLALVGGLILIGLGIRILVSHP